MIAHTEANKEIGFSVTVQTFLRWFTSKEQHMAYCLFMNYGGILSLLGRRNSREQNSEVQVFLFSGYKTKNMFEDWTKLVFQDMQLPALL